MYTYIYIYIYVYTYIYIYIERERVYNDYDIYIYIYICAELLALRRRIRQTLGHTREVAGALPRSADCIATMMIFRIHIITNSISTST